MRLMLRQAKKDDDLRQLAAMVVGGIEPKDWCGEVAALFDFIKKTVRYLRDVTYCETLATPWQTIEQGFGDCDDQALALASLLESVGYDTRFTAMSFWPNPQPSHIMAEVLLGSDWVSGPVVSLDTTEDRPMGWRPPDVWRQLIIYNGDGPGD